jgi:hypothetical protein
MSRRGLLFALVFPLCAPLYGDDAQDVWGLLTEEASALSEGNTQAFLAGFDPSMPGYEMLRMNVSALLEQNQVQSSIELLSEEAIGGMRTVDLDWFLQIVEQQDTGGLTRRRERVRCRVAKQGKKWRITALEPISFFAPPVGGAGEQPQG